MEYLNTAALFLVAFTFGGMVFFSFVMAPLIFIKLEPDTAAKFIRQVFPVYYITMAVSSILLAATLLSSQLYYSVTALLVSLTFFWLWKFLMPKINTLRDAQKEGDTKAGKRFDFLHRLSVQINFVQIVCVGGILFLLS